MKSPAEDLELVESLNFVKAWGGPSGTRLQDQDNPERSDWRMVRPTKGDESTSDDYTPRVTK